MHREPQNMSKWGHNHPTAFKARTAFEALKGDKTQGVFSFGIIFG